jgi:hypothetical protein
MSGTIWLGRDGVADTEGVLEHSQSYLELHVGAARAMLAAGVAPAEVFEQMLTVKLGASGPTFDQLALMYCVALMTLAQQAGYSDEG